jgi:transcriptional regulator with XRE-family HTH domain
MKKPPDRETTEPFVGLQIRQLRKQRGLTLAKLAEAAGVSVPFISLVERNMAQPSVKTLHAISRALGVTISWFFNGPSEEPAAATNPIVRGQSRRRLRYDSGITDELLSPSLAGQLELLRSTFAPGATSGEQPYTHAGEEAGVVLKGQLELTIDGETFLLKAGDSFGFQSSLPHRYRNVGEESVEVIWAITPPSY